MLGEEAPTVGGKTGDALPDACEAAGLDSAVPVFFEQPQQTNATMNSVMIILCMMLI